MDVFLELFGMEKLKDRKQFCIENPYRTDPYTNIKQYYFFFVCKSAYWNRHGGSKPVWTLATVPFGISV